MVLLTLGLVAATTSALAVAPSANATNEPYSCSSCKEKNGAVNYVQNVTGTDYARARVCVYLWPDDLKEPHGGCSDLKYSYDCLSEAVYGHFHGHGETTNFEPLTAEHLSGRETNFTNYPEECKPKEE